MNDPVGLLNGLLIMLEMLKVSTMFLGHPVNEKSIMISNKLLHSVTVTMIQCH